MQVSRAMSKNRIGDGRGVQSVHGVQWAGAEGMGGGEGKKRKPGGHRDSVMKGLHHVRRILDSILQILMMH